MRGTKDEAGSGRTRIAGLSEWLDTSVSHCTLTTTSGQHWLAALPPSVQQCCPVCSPLVLPAAHLTPHSRLHGVTRCSSLTFISHTSTNTVSTIPTLHKKMNSPRVNLCSVLLLCCSLASLWTDVSALVMPQVFNTHMVLQRAPLRAKLWGEAAPQSTVTCAIDKAEVLEVQTDDEGHFMCEMQPVALSWNRTVTVTGDKQSIVFTDVAFGDVVMCLGSEQLYKHTCSGTTALTSSRTSLIGS